MRLYIFILFLSVGVIAACSPTPENGSIPENININTSLVNQNAFLPEATDLSQLMPVNFNKNTSTLAPQVKEGIIVNNRDTSARFEVVSVDTDYQDKNPLFKRNVAEEYQLIRIGVRITGTSEQDFPFDNLNFSLDTPTVKTIVESELGKANEVQDHIVQQVQIGKGKVVQGALYFEVAKGLSRNDLVLSYESLTEQRGSKEYKMGL